MFDLHFRITSGWFEAGSELLIVIFFMVGACVRYKDLRTLGKSSDSYSGLLWAKISVFTLLILIHIV